MDSYFRDSFLDKRITLLDNILDYTRGSGIKNKDFWTLKKSDVRFSIGETEFNVRIPFIFGGESEEIIEEALEELLSLIKGRFEPSVVYDSRGGIMISVLDESVKLQPKGYRLGNEFSTRIEYNAAQLTLLSDSLIDAGIISSWLSPKLHGKKFVNEIARIYKKAIDEEIRFGGTEKTSLLTHFAVAKILSEKKEFIKKINIAGTSYEKLERSISIFFYALITSIIQGIFQKYQGKQLSYDIKKIEYLLLGSTTPFFVLGIKNALLASEINPYNLSLKIITKLDSTYSSAAKKSISLSDLILKMTNLIIEDKMLMGNVLEFYSISKFRDDILDYLVLYDDQREETDVLLAQVVYDEKVLSSLRDNQKMASMLESGLQKLKVRYHSDIDRVRKIEQISNHLKMYRRWGGGRVFSSGREGEKFKISEVLKRYVAYRIDLGYDTYITTSINALENKKNKLPLRELIRSYDEGRLYRISADHKLSLVKVEGRNEAHLFVDLKGFTRRTRKSGSLAMAEFLKLEFFIPIIEAAKTYYLKVGKDPSLGLDLNNLLGDAVTFSGNILALFELAKEIRTISSQYQKKLIERYPEYDEKGQRDKLMLRYQAELNKIAENSKAIVGAIIELNEIVDVKKGMSPREMMNAQLNLFNKNIEAHVHALGEISAKIKNTSSNDVKLGLVEDEEILRGKLAFINKEKEGLKLEVKKQRLDKRSMEFYKEICQDEIVQIRRLKEMLAAILKKKRELIQSYYERLGEIVDFGMNTGLYISYGEVMELIDLRDNVWGDVKVSIADKINEAARGAARSKNIKKRVDRFVERCSFEMNNQNLIYPFNVIIGTNYSIIQPIDEEPTFYGEETDYILDFADRVFSEEGDEKKAGSKFSDWEKEKEQINRTVVSSSVDIYNLGEALSGDALRAFVRESRGKLYFFEKRVLIGELNEKFWKFFAFDGTEIQFIFGIEDKKNRINVEMFRYTGSIDYVGTSKKELTDVYELLRTDSLFYHFIMDNHFDAWYEDSKLKDEQSKGIARL
jgi:hypothetical protein